MILRDHCGGTVLWFFVLCLIFSVQSDVLEPSILSTPDILSNEIEVGTENDNVFRRRSSIVGGDVVSGARNLDSRIDTSLNIVKNKLIPNAIESVEADIAIANRDRVILGLANFLGMWFGILSVTAASTDWENLADGAKIQVLLKFYMVMVTGALLFWNSKKVKWIAVYQTWKVLLRNTDMLRIMATVV